MMTHAKERHKTAMMAQYRDHLTSVHEPGKQFIPMMAYNLVLGLRWCKTLKPGIDCATGQLTSLRPPRSRGEARRSGMIVHWYNCRDDKSTKVPLPDIGGSTPMINSTSELPGDVDGKPRVSREDSPTPDIEILGETTCNDLLPTNVTIETFALRLGHCS